MSHIFVSYSQPDAECAHELVRQLEGHGLTCWIAPRDITPARDWASEIIDAIAAARIMVLVFSQSSNHSPQVRREVERAVHKQVDILPFRIENVIPSKSLEFFLSAQHWMDAFPPPREAYYERLCHYLKGHPAMGLPEPGLPESGQPAMPRPSGAEAILEGHGVGAAQLARIEEELAVHIGPLAKHLVKRAAGVSKDGEELIVRLAQEIDAQAQRSAFLQRCRRLLSP
jgi:hypothetical protein